MNFLARKKAMNSMTSEKPSLQMKEKMTFSDQLGEAEKLSSGKGELIAMMVTPEEKEMIESMRKGETEEGEESEEMDEELAAQIMVEKPMMKGKKPSYGQ